MFTQNFTKLSAAVHELSCAQRKKLRRKQYCPSLQRTVIKQLGAVARRLRLLFITERNWRYKLAEIFRFIARARVQ